MSGFGSLSTQAVKIGVWANLVASSKTVDISTPDSLTILTTSSIWPSLTFSKIYLCSGLITLGAPECSVEAYPEATFVIWAI